MTIVREKDTNMEHHNHSLEADIRAMLDLTVSRRQSLRWMFGAGAAAGLPLIGCGGGSDSASSTTAAATSAMTSTSTGTTTSTGTGSTTTTGTTTTGTTSCAVIPEETGGPIRATAPTAT